MFGGCRPTKYLTEPLRSNIWGLYTPQIVMYCHVSLLNGNYRWRVFNLLFGHPHPEDQIFDGTPSVKYLGAVHPPNI